MDTRGTSMRPVAIMQYAQDEAEDMFELNALWVQTMDLKHDNVLAYPLDIMVEHVNEVCQRKYIDEEDFFTYEAENHSHWLISKNLHIDDMDAFFKVYFHEQEAA